MNFSERGRKCTPYNIEDILGINIKDSPTTTTTPPTNTLQQQQKQQPSTTTARSDGEDEENESDESMENLSPILGNVTTSFDQSPVHGTIVATTPPSLETSISDGSEGMKSID